MWEMIKMARKVKISTLTINPIPEAEIVKGVPLYDCVLKYLEKQLKYVLVGLPWCSSG